MRVRRLNWARAAPPYANPDPQVYRTATS
jgi:hypothetical protein